MGLFKKDKRKMPPPPPPPSSRQEAPPEPRMTPVRAAPPNPPSGRQETRPAQPQQSPRPPSDTAAPQSRRGSDSPPLFIKIEKYRDIIKNIMEAKSFILNIKDAMDALEDVQKQISDGVKVAQKTLDDLNTNLANLDSFFIKPGRGGTGSAPAPQRVPSQPPSPPGTPDQGVPQPRRSQPADKYADDVYGQLERLRSQLKSLK